MIERINNLEILGSKIQNTQAKRFVVELSSILRELVEENQTLKDEIFKSRNQESEEDS